MKKWNDVWADNYYNRSDAAKDIDKLMKKNYKGHKYVPWAVMQKWFYLMDENATIEIVENSDGGIVHSDTVLINDSVSDYKDGVETKGTAVSRMTHAHRIKIKATFLGKEMVDNYFVQDNAYNATNFIDSNMVNNSVQRGKARMISMITGLGYQLYEFGDLQFEDDTPKNEENVEVIKTTKAPTRTDNKTKKVEVKDAGEDTNSVSDKISQDHLDLAKYMVDNKDTILPVIQKINVNFVKQYSTSINLDDTVNNIANVLTHVANIKVFGNAIKKQHKELNK